MGTAEVFEAFGGGLAAVLAVAVMSLFGMLLYQLNARIKDRDDAVKERDERIRDLNQKQEKSEEKIVALTQAINRQTDLMQSWMPGRQLEQYREYRTMEPRT